ncbi:hypothetical protein [Barnesiella intestinihominis]|uniref:hypothetical protein n=1 Tax=Barnesiella intestinihominis TaxID=487174 RepID=UPI00307CCD76
MRKQILTDNETKAFLIKTFQCSRQAVWQALTFQRNSDQARRIRHLALQRGGKLTDGYAPKCETSYEEGEKTMTQRFGSRVKIVAYSETGNVSVFVDDRLKESYENLDVCSLMQLQSEVEQMAAVL